jgi:PBP1b-binding outer membrane lipoprotein LpoB
MMQVLKIIYFLSRKMKKVGLLIVAALFLSSCSFKKGQKDVDIYSNTIKIPNTGEVENKKIKFSEGEKKVYSIS